ncbi:GMC oxidoreductase [Parathielavia hyrcaniae]|uniref:GMC oxidoreductase n=1 Tax=Parathielavia hyrcaniae TaxID=113614 RepID=A0AAN6PXY1_9PEZI|nr:GMC oxidoreductase [Parathielavia hyrcaniae]
MGLYNHLPEGLNEVDIIIAGGGSAGCIVAGRLAAADPKLSILLIERGADNKNVPSIIHPVLFSQNWVPANNRAIFYPANKAVQLADRAPMVVSGGTLGGGSSINVGVYARAQRSDYDSWETPGWSTEELLPYLKKLETYHGTGDAKVHGYDGPVHVSDGGFRSKTVEDEALRVAKVFGYPEVADIQDFDSNNAFGRWFRTVSPQGRRQDSAHTFLHPLLEDGEHPNLHVLVEHQVSRVLFDDEKRACGVEFIANPLFQTITPLPEDSKQTIRARKLVVVSSGACGSPSILERSGLGDPAVLERARVPLLVDLPGVGNEYEDHNLTVTPYKSSLKPDETADSILLGRITAEDAISMNHPMLGWNMADILGKIRPTDAAVAALGPEFQAAWDRDYRDKPDRPLILTCMFGGYFGNPAFAGQGQHVCAASFTAYPSSRGHIHITGPDVGDKLDFDVGFLTDEHDLDLKKLVWAYKHSREMVRRTAFYRGEMAAGHPRFPDGSRAACVELDAPLFASDRSCEVRDLEYSAEDDAAIEKFMRENMETTWHSLGTLKMAPRENMGVVDKDLNVYGVERLKVVDMSIPPKNVGANTNNTAMMIGERGASIIARELGICLPSTGALK